MKIIEEVVTIKEIEKTKDKLIKIIAKDKDYIDEDEAKLSLHELKHDLIEWFIEEINDAFIDLDR